MPRSTVGSAHLADGSVMLMDENYGPRLPACENGLGGLTALVDLKSCIVEMLSSAKLTRMAQCRLNK